MQTIQNYAINALETVKDKLEERDQDIVQRPKVFSETKPQTTEEIVEAP